MEREMKTAIKHIFSTVAFAIAMAFTAAAASAGSYDVFRSSTLENGVYVPALVVIADENRTVFKLGENGLTRDIVFNAEKSASFARENIALPASLSIVKRGGGAIEMDPSSASYGKEASSSGESW
jgi:hypothetical protein